MQIQSVEEASERMWLESRRFRPKTEATLEKGSERHRYLVRAVIDVVG